MSIVKINAISVPEGMGDTLEGRFAARTKALRDVAGFEGFELLRPTAGETRYFVYTRWADEASYQAWRNSEKFGEGHAHGGGAGQGAGHGGDGEQQRPVGMGADLLEFEVVLTDE